MATTRDPDYSHSIEFPRRGHGQLALGSHACANRPRDFVMLQTLLYRCVDTSCRTPKPTYKRMSGPGAVLHHYHISKTPVLPLGNPLMCRFIPYSYNCRSRTLSLPHCLIDDVKLDNRTRIVLKVASLLTTWGHRSHSIA